MFKDTTTGIMTKIHILVDIPCGFFWISKSQPSPIISVFTKIINLLPKILNAAVEELEYKHTGLSTKAISDE